MRTRVVCVPRSSRARIADENLMQNVHTVPGPESCLFNGALICCKSNIMAGKSKKLFTETVLAHSACIFISNLQIGAPFERQHFGL
jgi:hypothetical protein